MSLIQLHRVDFSIGGPLLLEHVDLSIDRNERVCIVGRNGEDKSTLMKLIAGELKPDDGEVRVQNGIVIARMAQERPALLVGAGTVLDRISLDIAIKSGAQFGLAPGFDAEIVDHAADAGFPFVPGIMTPSELSAAMRRGAQAVKFFPAGTIGGPEALKSIAAPFAHLGLKFIPTGGVSPANLADWLKVPGVAAVGGTWIAKTEDIRNAQWAKIAANCREAVAAVQQHRHARA